MHLTKPRGMLLYRIKVSGPWQWTAFGLIAEECLRLLSKWPMMQYGAMAMLATAMGMTAALVSDDLCLKLFDTPAFMVRDQLVSIAVNQTAKLAGRGIRYWWQGLTENQRKRHTKTLKKSVPLLGITAMAVLAVTVGFYMHHTVVDPYTKRAVFSLCSDRDMKDADDCATRFVLKEFGSLDYHKYDVHDGSLVEVINNTVSLIVAANPAVAGHIPWKVDLGQAFTLPRGSMLFGRDLWWHTDDQISSIVGHKMAHCIRRHHTVMISQQRLFNVTKLLPLTVAYACTTESGDIVVEPICSMVYSLAFELPLTVSRELEADRYGQELIAAIRSDQPN
ncbi:metalloendopeptidase OMA1, mitochondrial-like [Adelges cooleyi]|uniref:metalloendopeptidase OMA1, mitochondrial-like n=1 Tax=Adelges cooleyi TaxID=133065 RepID=UPI00217FAB6C|nr:metalloendopeptidase OMA1, mitochondrial-like [Adelges cooleyi]